MRRRPDAPRLRALAGLLALAALLGGCADIYYDRRDTVAFHAGDAVEQNKVTHIIDPWPRAAANRHLETNGQRMQRAIERYRTNRTTPLGSTPTSSVQYQPVLAPVGGGTGTSP